VFQKLTENLVGYPEQRAFQRLITDIQGAELTLLQGAEPVLQGFQFIKLEVPDFESYKGCCQVKDIEEFLLPRGFREFARTQFAKRAKGGAYYDIVYRRVV
jgi:hypothetical protein